MTQPFGSKNSDAAWLLTYVRALRQAMAFVIGGWNFRALLLQPVPILALCGFIWNLTVYDSVHAQQNQQPWLRPPSQPNSSSSGDSLNPKRVTDGVLSRPAQSTLSATPLVPSKSVKQSSMFEGDDDQPKTPFQLDEPLVEVRIEGNSTIPDPEIAKHIKVRSGRPVTQKQIKDDVDALVRTRWFASVEPTLRQSDEGMVLVFRVLERPIVRRVEYKGLKKIKQKTFDSLTQLKPGSPFDIASNRECARRIEEHYHDKGYTFATVELEKGNDRDDREVVFLIREGPKVKVTSVKFDGNKQFISGILKTKTRTKTAIAWVFGGKYDPSTIKDDIEGVKQYYHSLGYFDVEITHEEKFSDDKSRLEIHYHIDEGIRSKIRNIEIAGNQILSEDEIRNMMKVNGGIFYNARDINMDVEKIKTKYGEQGRLFCRVDAVPRWTEEEGVVDIQYKIEEDKVYRVRNINVHILGDHPHTKTNLVRNVATIHPGDLADPRMINLFKSRLEGSQYFESGRGGGGAAGVRVETNVVRGDSWINKGEYDVARSQTADTPTHRSASKPPTDFTAPSAGATREPGLPAGKRGGTFGLHGWIGTKASRMESRDPFVGVASYFDESVKPLPIHAETPKAAAEDRLSPITPIFRAQSRDPLKPPANFGTDAGPQGDPFGRAINNPDPDNWVPPPTAPDFVDLDTYLTEARTGRLMFGVGVNSNAGLVGNITLSEQNFDILRPPTHWSQIYDGTAWRGGGQKFKIEAMPGTQVSRYLVDWQDPYFLDSNFNLGVSGFYFTRYYRNWYENRFGGRIRVGRQLTPKWSTSLALRLEDVDIYNPSVPTPQLLTRALGNSLLSTLRGSLIHDTRDRAFNATEGHYFEISYEQAFGQFNFPRFEVEGRQYFTTYRRVDGQGKHTLLFHGQSGWTGNNTPIYENFFAGGFQSFRGFAFRGIGPSDKGVLTGGTFMLLGGAEYQLPVTANEMVKIVGFTDMGTINNAANFSDFRVAVGAGFRFTVPMIGPVPIAVDFAIPVIHDKTDIQQVISFYVGMNR